MKKQKSTVPEPSWWGISKDGYQIFTSLYEYLPEEVKRAWSIDEIHYGEPFLYRTWYGSYVLNTFTPEMENFVRKHLRAGRQIFIKKPMEEYSMKTFPYQSEISISMYGRSIPVWVYDKVPEGMKRANSFREFYNGRQFLIRSRINPDIYLTDIFRPSVSEAVRLSLEAGAEIYIK